MISYDNDIWYIEGTDAGFYLLNNDEQQLELKISYQWQAYDASEGNTPAMRHLDDRRDTLMTGLSYQYITPFGAFETQLLADTLQHSQGVSATVAYLSHLQFNRSSLIPSVGVVYDNAQQNRYFYGISTSESQRSGLPVYRPHDSFTPYFTLTLDHFFTQCWESYLASQVDFLTATIRNSPMIDRDVTFTINMGVNYHF